MAVDIKNLSDYSEKIRNVSHILTETLGTTTSYTFLEDTLLPYVKKNLKTYVLDHWSDDEVVDIVKALKKQAGSEVKQGWVGAIEIPEGDDGDATKEAIITYALSQLDGSNVETLNRLVVKDGYSKGNLKGHVFPDVIPALKKWTEEGKKIYIYSSGVEMSQQCFVSIDGDTSELISGCFESSEFPGNSCESFRELCKKVDSPADKIAFLTHNASTACAAHKAGLVVIMLSREGNRYIGNCTRENFPVITSFEDISKQICGKRKQAPDAVESTEGKRAKLDDGVSKKETEMDKPKEEAVKTTDEKSVETAVAVDGKVEAESKASGEEEMEVDEASEETKAKDEKAGATEVTVVVTPPAEEVNMKEGEDGKVNGGPEEAMEAIEEAKVESEDDKEKSESPLEKEGGAEKVEEKVSESKEEDKKEEELKAKEPEEKVVKDSGSEKAESEKDTKEDNGAVEVKADKGEETEDKVDETPSTEAEKTKENGVAEATTVENGASGEEGQEKKEVIGNGINGGGDGVAGKEVDKPTEVKDPEKIVAKKVEKEDEKVELAAEAVKECA